MSVTKLVTTQLPSLLPKPPQKSQVEDVIFRHARPVDIEVPARHLFPVATVVQAGASTPQPPTSCMGRCVAYFDAGTMNINDPQYAVRYRNVKIIHRVAFIALVLVPTVAIGAIAVSSTTNIPIAAEPFIYVAALAVALAAIWGAAKVRKNLIAFQSVNYMRNHSLQSPLMVHRNPLPRSRVMTPTAPPASSSV